MAVVGINSEDSAPVAISFRNPFLVGHVIFDIFDAGLLINGNIKCKKVLNVRILNVLLFTLLNVLLLTRVNELIQGHPPLVCEESKLIPW